MIPHHDSVFFTRTGQKEFDDLMNTSKEQAFYAIAEMMEYHLKTNLDESECTKQVFTYFKFIVDTLAVAADHLPDILENKQLSGIVSGLLDILISSPGIP